jgi:hypothetical protein
VSGVDVGVAGARSLDLDAYLAGFQRRTRNLLQCQGTVELVHDSRPVGARLRLDLIDVGHCGCHVSSWRPLVQIPAARPYTVSFAAGATSAVSLNGIAVTTGPKISSS